MIYNVDNVYLLILYTHHCVSENNNKLIIENSEWIWLKSIVKLAQLMYHKIIIIMN